MGGACNFPMRTGACPLQPQDAQGRCLLHSEQEKDHAAVRQVVLALLAEGEARKEAVDLSGLVIRDVDLRDYRFETAVSFRGARLLGRCDFSLTVYAAEADFQDCRFEDKAFFTEAIFEQEADFSRATFEKGADFTAARFEAAVYFVKAAVHDGLQFMTARIGSAGVHANFSEMECTGGASFQNVRFRGDAHFGNAQFLSTEQDVTFTGSFEAPSFFIRTLFCGPTRFAAEFKEPATFLGAQIRGLARFHRAEFHKRGVFEDLNLDPQGRFADAGVSLAFMSVVVRETDGVRFRGAMDKPLDLSRVRFALSDTGRMRFENVVWPSRKSPAWKAIFGRDTEPGLRACDEGFLVEEQGAAPVELIGPVVDVQDDPNYDGVRFIVGDAREKVSRAHLEVMYKGLRLSYERALRYAEAGDFHVREMEMRRLSPEGGPAKRFVGRNLSLINAYRVLSRYGESYHRAGAWIAAVFVAFFAIRLAMGAGPADAVWDTFAGFLALQLKSGGRLDTFQGILCLPLLAFFGLALRRRFKR